MTLESVGAGPNDAVDCATVSALGGLWYTTSGCLLTAATPRLNGFLHVLAHQAVLGHFGGEWAQFSIWHSAEQSYQQVLCAYGVVSKRRSHLVHSAIRSL